MKRIAVLLMVLLFLAGCEIEKPANNATGTGTSTSTSTTSVSAKAVRRIRKPVKIDPMADPAVRALRTRVEKNPPFEITIKALNCTVVKDPSAVATSTSPSTSTSTKKISNLLFDYTEAPFPNKLECKTNYKIFYVSFKKIDPSDTSTRIEITSAVMIDQASRRENTDLKVGKAVYIQGDPDTAVSVYERNPTQSFDKGPCDGVICFQKFKEKLSRVGLILRWRAISDTASKDYEIRTAVYVY